MKLDLSSLTIISIEHMTDYWVTALQLISYSSYGGVRDFCVNSTEETFEKTKSECSIPKLLTTFSDICFCKYIFLPRRSIFFWHTQEIPDIFTLSLRTFLYFHDNKGVNEGILFPRIMGKISCLASQNRQQGNQLFLSLDSKVYTLEKLPVR